MARSGQKPDLRRRVRASQIRPPVRAAVEHVPLRLPLLDDTLLSRRLKGFLAGEPAVVVDVRPHTTEGKWRFVWPLRDEHEGVHEYVREQAAFEVACYFLEESLFGGEARLFASSDPDTPAETKPVQGRIKRGQPIPVAVDEQDIANILVNGQPLGTLPEQAALEAAAHRRTEGVIVLDNGQLVVVFDPPKHRQA